MWFLPKDACLAGKTVLRMPRDSTALQPCAAPTLGELSADSSEEVASKDFQDCLGGDGSARSDWVFQVETEKVQRHGAAAFPGVLRAVRTARLHLMSTGGGVGRGRTEVHRMQILRCPVGCGSHVGL